MGPQLTAPQDGMSWDRPHSGCRLRPSFSLNDGITVAVARAQEEGVHEGAGGITERGGGPREGKAQLEKQGSPIWEGGLDRETPKRGKGPKKGRPITSRGKRPQQGEAITSRAKGLNKGRLSQVGGTGLTKANTTERLKGPGQEGSERRNVACRGTGFKTDVVITGGEIVRVGNDSHGDQLLGHRPHAAPILIYWVYKTVTTKQQQAN